MRIWGRNIFFLLYIVPMFGSYILVKINLTNHGLKLKLRILIFSITIYPLWNYLIFNLVEISL